MAMRLSISSRAWILLVVFQKRNMEAWKGEWLHGRNSETVACGMHGLQASVHAPDGTRTVSRWQASKHLHLFLPTLTLWIMRNGRTRIACMCEFVVGASAFRLHGCNLARWNGPSYAPATRRAGSTQGMRLRLKVGTCPLR